jgi:hypothetical protein
MILGLIMCFSFHAHGGPGARGPIVRSVEIGFPDTWIHYNPGGFAIELLRWSVAIGLAATACLSLLVRIERAERHGRTLEKAARACGAAPGPAAGPNPATSAYTLPTGAGPMLLLCAGGMVVGGLCMTAGLALGALAFLQSAPGSGAFWGWMGSAFGCFFGGGGALVGSLNSYRQLTGRRDLLSEPHWTLLDRTLVSYTVLGVLLLAADGAVWRVAGGETRYALLLLGGMVCFQGVLVLVTRAAMRHAARERERVGG